MAKKDAQGWLSDSEEAKPDEQEEAPQFWAETKNARRGRDFPIRDVLQLVTGVMLSKDWDAQFDLCAYMSGQKLTATSKRHFKYVDYPLMLPYLKAEILAQHPQFSEYDDIRFDMENSIEDSAEWLAEVERKHGLVVKVDVLPDKQASELDGDIERKLREMNPPRKKKHQKARDLDSMLV